MAPDKIKLFRPSDLYPYLKDLGASPKKSLSQNFLTDGNILDKIVRIAEVKEDDFILEIGPGPGALTQALLNQGAHVLAVEKDLLFVKGLKNLKMQHPSLEVIEEDFLKLPLEELLSKQKKTWKVVANLPYQITTPILAKLFPLFPQISSLTIMVQKEVGERMVAESGEKSYSRLSLFTQYFSSPKCCFTFSPNSFYPRPKVSSCVMHLKLHTPPAISSEKGLFELIKKAFMQKRKMLRSSLTELYRKESVEECLSQLSLFKTARPQDLSLEAFIRLYESLSEASSRGP